MRKPVNVFVQEQDKEGIERATEKANPDASWVLQGLGYPLRIWNGITCKIKERKLYSHFFANPEALPQGFEPAYEEEHEGPSVPGWIPVDSVSQEFVYHREAWQAAQINGVLPDGLYVLVGPSIKNNIENIDHHMFFGVNDTRLDRKPYADFPRNFDSIRGFLKNNEMHGIMWINDDGRRAFVTYNEFGFRRMNEAPVIVQEPSNIQHQYINQLKIENKRLLAMVESKDREFSMLEDERDDLKESLTTMKAKIEVYEDNQKSAKPANAG